MSRIKRLKLKGFKSFANPTILNFENGFNTIVGANGSGKSNVFDALCFVLGRMSSKGLRADKLGNLVFNGGKTTKPSKEAEVAIYLSNENQELMNIELDEIKLSRVVKKDGKSDYFLNNKKATRTEIVEILKRGSIDPDGYNIILQGDIMKIVNMTPVERRELIEEIANISNYEEKRQKSLKKLETVELDLKNADLLLEEKTKYIKELKSEKEAATRFYQVKEDLRFNNLLLVKAKLIRNTLLNKKKEEDIESKEAEIKIYKEKLDAFEQEEKQIDAKLTDLEKSIEIKSHQDFISVTNRITALEGETQNLKEKRAEIKKQIEEVKTKSIGIKENIKINKEKTKQIEADIIVLQKNKKELEKKLEIIEADLLEFKKGISTEGFKELDEIDMIIDELNEKKHNKTLIKQDNAIQVEKLNTKLEHFENDLKKIEQSSSSNKEQLKELDILRKKLKTIIIKISELVSKNSQDSAKVANMQKEYSELVEQHSRLKMKVESSKDLMATNKAVDSILKLKARDGAIHGTVAELGSASEKYSMALESVAGRNLFNIVVENDATAVKYIKHLKENRIGNCTFLPLNKVNAKFRLDDTVLNKKGVVDYALNLIKFDKRYEHIFHLVFADTIVIEKIEDAKGVGIGDYKMVTLDGDLVAKTGAMSGGFKSRSQGLGAFKDDKSVTKLAELDSRIISLKSTLDHLRTLKDEGEKQIYELRQEKVEIEGEVGKFEKILSIEGRDTDSIKKEIEAIIGDKKVIEGSLKKIDRDISLIEEELQKVYDKKNKIKAATGGQGSAFSNISKLEEQRDKLKEQLRTISTQIDGSNIQIKNVLAPEIINLEKILKESEIAISNMNQKVTEITTTLNVLEEELKEFRAKEKELSKDYKDFIAKRDKLKEDRKKVEEKYEKEYSKFDKIKETLATLNYAVGEFATLNKTLNDELEILYEELKIEFIEKGDGENKEEGEKKISDLLDNVENTLKTKDIDVKELQSKVNNLKSKLNSFGSINMKAVEIYDKLNEEFNALIEKRQSLTEEKLDIMKLVEEMDLKKKEKFLETFYQLRDNFIRIFGSLSTKGEAELNLENENDIFNNGVEIRVKMTAKNYLDIKSLSGGEKTITAIAFIFSVQEFNPASFYIFDEVDAALDIMNAEKLGKLISDYSKNAQYIVVSHSEHLIQSSDIIYGVTMDQYKISDVVSLDLRQAEEYVDTEAKTS